MNVVLIAFALLGVCLGIPQTCPPSNVYPGPSQWMFGQAQFHTFTCSSSSATLYPGVTFVNVSVTSPQNIWGIAIQTTEPGTKFNIALYDNQLNLLIAADCRDTRTTTGRGVVVCPVGRRMISGSYGAVYHVAVATTNMLTVNTYSGTGWHAALSTDDADVGVFPFNFESAKLSLATTIPNVFLLTTPPKFPSKDGAICEASPDCQNHCCCETDGGYICAQHDVCLALNGACMNSTPTANPISPPVNPIFNPPSRPQDEYPYFQPNPPANPPAWPQAWPHWSPTAMPTASPPAAPWYDYDEANVLKADAKKEEQVKQ